MNIGLRPNLTIKSDAGNVVSIEVTNCNDRPSVASHGTGDNKLPTSAVLIIFTFIVVIDSACATDSLITLPVLLFAFITTPSILVTFCETKKTNIANAADLDLCLIIAFSSLINRRGSFDDEQRPNLP